MTKPFKFRNVHEIVGLFVILVVFLLVTGVVMIGHAQKWFHPRLSLQVRFPPEGTFGIQKGSKIVILGANAGEVGRIFVDESGDMMGRLRISSEYARFIRTDTRALVKKTLGVAGDSFIEMIAGTGAPVPSGRLKAGYEIPIQKDTELIEQAQKLIAEIQNAVLPVLQELEKTLMEYRGLAADLRAPGGAVNTTVTNLNAVIVSLQTTIDGLNRGEGTAGKILKDPALHNQGIAAVEQVNLLLKQVNETMRKVDAMAADLKETAAHLPRMAGRLEGELNQAQGIVLQTQGTLREAEKTLQGVQRHWILRSYVEQEHPLEPLPADRVGTPAGGAR